MLRLAQQRGLVASRQTREPRRPVREPGLPSTLALDIALTGPQAQIVQVGLPELRNIGVDRGIPLFGAIGRTDDGFSVTLARDAVDGEQEVEGLSIRWTKDGWSMNVLNREESTPGSGELETTT